MLCLLQMLNVAGPGWRKRTVRRWWTFVIENVVITLLQYYLYRLLKCRYKSYVADQDPTLRLMLIPYGDASKSTVP